jgi:hypothetical protein
MPECYNFIAYKERGLGSSHHSYMYTIRNHAAGIVGLLQLCSLCVLIAGDLQIPHQCSPPDWFTPSHVCCSQVEQLTADAHKVQALQQQLQRAQEEKQDLRCLPASCCPPAAQLLPSQECHSRCHLASV